MDWKERLVNIPALLLLLPSIREQQQSYNKVSEELYYVVGSNVNKRIFIWLKERILLHCSLLQLTGVHRIWPTVYVEKWHHGKGSIPKTPPRLIWMFRVSSTFLTKPPVMGPSSYPGLRLTLIPTSGKDQVAAGKKNLAGTLVHTMKYL